MRTAKALAALIQSGDRYERHSATGDVEACVSIEACAEELKALMIHHRRQLNDSKTEVLVITTPNSVSKHNLTDVVNGDNIFKPTTVARNLEVMFDTAFNMKPQVSKLYQYYHLHKIRSIRDCHTQHAT